MPGKVPAPGNMERGKQTHLPSRSAQSKGAFDLSYQDGLGAGRQSFESMGGFPDRALRGTQELTEETVACSRDGEARGPSRRGGKGTHLCVWPG